MPSRRRLLVTLGTATTGAVAGCTSADTTSGAISRKKIGVGVPRSDDDPIEVAIALLTFEPDRNLVTGEYADIADEAIQGTALGVPEQVHDRLSDRFSSVRYLVNVVPDDSTTTANGLVTREDFNALSTGGTATVESYMSDGGGRLRVSRAAPRKGEPTEVAISQYSFDERVDGI